MGRIKLRLDTPIEKYAKGPSGKRQTWMESQLKGVLHIWSQTEFGQEILQTAKYARYGAYGVAAFALVKVVSYANNVYTWWSGSKDSRERARLEKKLDRLNNLLGPDVNLVGLIQEEHTESPQRRRG